MLSGNADSLTDDGGVANDVNTCDGGRAFGRLGERGEYADCRCLAGAVVTEETEDGPGSNVKVEVSKRPKVAESLAQPVARHPGGSLRMVYRIIVHSTFKDSSTRYAVRRGK